MNRQEVGGSFGGVAGGALTGTVCGPGAPICSGALIIIGGIAGGIGDWDAIEVWEDELDEFTKWTVFQVFL